MDHTSDTVFDNATEKNADRIERSSSIHSSFPAAAIDPSLSARRLTMKESQNLSGALLSGTRCSTGRHFPVPEGIS
jgi:hypothetical protein